MRAPWPSARAAKSGTGSCLALCLLTLLSLIGQAWSQSRSDRWVTLATRTIDSNSGRATIDVRKAVGGFKAVRIGVRSGALTLTGIEVRYGDGTIYREPRALVLRPSARTLPIDIQYADRFIDALLLSFKAAEIATEPVVIAIEGLQSPGGAVMVRAAPPTIASVAPPSAVPASPPAAISDPSLRSGTTEERRRAEESERARLEATRQAAELVRRKEAEAAAKSSQEAARLSPMAKPSERPAGDGAAPQIGSVPKPVSIETAALRPVPAPGGAPSPVLSGGATTAAITTPAEPWDVVPVYFGTDRAPEPKAQRAAYGSDRGKRLEVGRALVTVPKRHEVPNVERPWVYRLPFTSIVVSREREDPTLHFTLKEVQALSQEAFLAAVRERLGLSRSYKNHALVFVHGFNTSFDNALYRIAQIAYDLKFDGAAFVYSWPSKGAIGLSDYNYDRESTGQAEPHLRSFLELIARNTGATSISVIAHSMGNQLLLPVLRDLRRIAPHGIAINQVILAAPDVDRDTFEYLAQEIAGVSKGVTMFAASTDRALDVSRRFWGGVPRAGDVPKGGPIVVVGIDTIDMTAISSDVFSANHSGYAEKAVVLQDIQVLIRTGQRPPEKRLPILERVTTAKGDYWRFSGPK